MKLPMNLKPVEFGTVVWHVDAPIGQSLDDILKPEYWTHVARQLRPGHEVKVVSEDRTLWAHLLVRSVGKMEAKLDVIHKVEFGEEKEVSAADEFCVKWRSPTTQWGVFRNSDNECMESGFQTKEEAGLWIVERAKSMAA